VCAPGPATRPAGRNQSKNRLCLVLREADEISGLGVLLIWGSVTLVSGLVKFLFQGDRAVSTPAVRDPDVSSKLARDQFCLVCDILTPDGLKPTKCLVANHEFQIDPSNNDLHHFYTASVDARTLVMVCYDKGEPDIIKGKSYTTDIDTRPVMIYFVSGPLSGKVGAIERYKIQPLRRAPSE
jgi:hypothetical protein